MLILIVFIIKISLAVFTPNNAIGRKINPDGTLAWMTVLLFRTSIKTLSIDPKETIIWFTNNANPLLGAWLRTDTGAVYSIVQM